MREAAEQSGVSVATLRRWVKLGLVPLENGHWTPAAVAQARVVARMRERGHSLESIAEAATAGRLAFGFAADQVGGEGDRVTIEEAAAESGLEPALIERIMVLLGTPADRTRELTRDDLSALRHCATVLEAGFPLVALLQLVRVYAQAMRRVADAEVRLFHLYVHEPLIQGGRAELEIAEEMGKLAAGILPLAGPVFDYMHRRYLRYSVEQDVVGHMESAAESEGASAATGRVSLTICFIDLTGFTRFTEEAGDEEALDRIERFVEAVELTLPREATIVKAIGDELMVVSPDPARLTSWAVGFLTLFTERPRPRVGIHYGSAVYRDGDYFGGDVNLTHRVVNRAIGGEVLVTNRVASSIEGAGYLETEAIGAVALKGFPEPTPLFSVRSPA
ncbi:MAG TPA: adenylate cyclase regulatory domain-containing protein [Solirubrobacterales bacterium]|nr:adenylate cyclase regulatory domain-containing protein [Solirubrobacterales bacterium]